jgi:nucleotide-binding universal stress UspA family protein
VGEPYRVIQEIIDTEKPGLVVMNIHGKAMLDRFLLGSTAERVVRSCADKCAFLLIPRARNPKQQD